MSDDYVPYAPSPAPERRSRTGLWITLAILATIALIVGSCSWAIVAMSGDLGGGQPTSFGQGVAVIHIDGVIAGTGSASGGYITPEDFRASLQQAEDDDSVKAVVLRVDSPGGTVAASEEIAQYVKRTKLPVVVSIGDVGASGAYMVSSQADRIIALDGSAVGSIGVITEIPNVSGLLDKVGVEFQVITAGELKDTGSPYRSLTPSETALIKGQIDEAYRQFIDIVAEGRKGKLTRAEVEKLATGWAWSGAEAKKLGLVDEVGTLDDALDAAAKLGGIKGEDYDVIDYDQESFEDVFSELFMLSRKLDKLDALTDPATGVTSPVVPR